MKLFFTFLISTFLIFALKAQNFNGQWKGSFADNSGGSGAFGGGKIDYVIELECNGKEVAGYSYTYYMENGKRYYTICKLTGVLNSAIKQLTFTEIERTKFNTPADISNCFQTHTLKYIKDNPETESLVGSWVPAPNQNGNCGYGKTILSRTILKRNPLIKSKENAPVAIKNKSFKDMNRLPKKPVAKTITPPKKQNNASPVQPPVKNTTVNNSSKPKQKNDTIIKTNPVSKPPERHTETVVTPKIKYENRINSVLKTISIQNETFTVDFYDNGEIDGDSISVFFNGKLVLSHQMLSYKPITLKLTVDPDKAVNELVMYAENLGEIPPNTALMIVHDGDNRYEQRIESDLGRNGTIRFSYKPKH